MLLILIGGTMIAGSALASIIAFDLSKPFIGKDNPDGSPPWLTAVFNDDTGNPNTVELTLTANLIDDNFISEFYFNSSAVVNLTPIATPLDSVIHSGNTLMADGTGGTFDYLLNFNTSNSPSEDRFDGSESHTYILTSNSGVISAETFNLTADGSLYHVAAHIQSISMGEGSTWIADPVPEPASMLLFSFGVAGLVGIVRHKKAK